MRSFSRYKKSRGFTLVELMIVVAIIGVLAALAIYGVRRYLASAKTSEAKNTLGSIARSAQGAFEREQNFSQLLAPGAGAQLSHDLCGSSALAPTSLPSAQKIQPDPAEFEAVGVGNSANVGWMCLKFSLSTPVYYQYGYDADRINGVPTTETAGAAAAPGTLTARPSDAFHAFAMGDLDGDGTASAFGMQGAIDGPSRTIKIATQVEIFNEYE